VIAAALLLSGASGLIFEIVWFHLGGLVFGNSIWATSIVLSSFMGGLALGSALVVRHSHRIRSFFTTYAVLEVIVGISGIALTIALPELPRMLTPMTSRVVDTPWLLNMVRVASAFAVLMVPATAMGATLPVLAGGLASGSAGYGRVLGRLYGWNTLGAVAGIIAAETVLIPNVGILGSALIAGTLNGCAAVVVFRRSKRVPGVTARMARPVRGVRAASIPWRIASCAFLAGAGLMALEVVWFRALSLFVASTTLAASLMLAAVLTGIALGGMAASAFSSRRDDAESYVPMAAFLIVAVVVASYQTFHSVIGDAWPREWHRILWLTVWLTFPASAMSGFLFALLGQAMRRHIASDAQTTGWLMLANTTGAMIGPLIAAFVLLPTIGSERGLFVLAALYGGIGLLAVPTMGAGRRASGWIATAAGVAAALMLASFPFGLMSGTYFVHAARPHTADGSQIIATREGIGETIFLTRQTWRNEAIYHRLVANGFSMTATAVPAQRYMRQFVYLPMLVRAAPLRNVLVICYGVGVTASAVTDIDTVESIDVVEISPDVVAMSDFIYGATDHPLRDPRVRLHIEDGRFFLQTTARRFDLITGEPPPPLTPGTVNLYTREYFQLIYDRLTEGGIATYWLPVARSEGVDHAAIIRAFCDVFDDCSLWNGTPADLMLMGARGARAQITAARFGAAWDDPRLGSRLREAGFEQPGQIGATFLGDAAYLNSLTAHSSPLVDDYPRRIWMSSHAAASREPQYLFDKGGEAYLAEILNPARTRRAFESSRFIEHLWPEAVRREAVPFFEVQQIINRVLDEGANVLGQIEDVHLLLTMTSLERLPYWLLGLGNHPILRHVDTMPNDGSGQVEYVRGLRALVARDFGAAATHLAEAYQRGLRGTRPLLAYALCLAGQFDAAKQIAGGPESVNKDQRHFWDWLRSAFPLK
jgi:predicted membrane-bound spermidine synthase